MALEQGLYWLLSNSAKLQEVLGTTGTRGDGMTGVYPAQMPENASLPSIVYQVISATSVNSLDGINSLGSKRVQFSCYGGSLPTAQIVADGIKEVLSTYRGDLSEGTRLEAAILNLELNDFDFTPYSYRVTLDYDIWAAAPITEPYPVPTPPPDMDLTLDGGTF